MMKLKYVKIFIVALSLHGVQSCTYLDVSDEVAGGLTDIDQVFDNVSYTKGWYSRVYAGIPDYTATFNAGGMSNVWSSYADELYNRIAASTGRYGEWGPANGNSGRWGLYEHIRQANIFLEKAKASMTGELGSDAAKITEAEMTWYKANVRFLRALYHFYLMELYGPIPIVDKSLTLDDELDLSRNSLDEVINFIDSELLAAMEDMADEPYHTTEGFNAVPTKGTALAVRAKLWAYAASPLFNGGYTEALGVKNLDGKALFPAKDDAKKQKALDACQDFIDYAEGNGGRYTLYVAADNNPNTSVYEVFQKYSKELIWAHGRTSWGRVQSGDSNTDRYSTPRSEPNGVGDIGPVQELVDDFYMADGLPTKASSFLPASPDYSASGFTEVNGVNVSNMYVGREPRFYNSVCYSGMKWHSGQEVQFYKGGNAGRGSGADAGVPITGYLWYKAYNRTVNGTTIVSAFRPSIIFRLADFYLLYAEVLNEVEPGNPKVLEYVNKVRRRAGIPNLETLNPGIVGNYTFQRDAIRRERRVELAGESQRYFDVRRWMIAENTSGEGRQGGDFHGMYLDGNQTTFFTVTKIQTRAFHRRYYLFPMPYDQMQKSKVLVQNPGWN